MQNLRILLVEEEELLRAGVRSLLDSRSNWAACEAKSLDEAVETAKSFQPDVVVLGLGCSLDGEESVIREIFKTLPKTEILLLVPRGSERSAAQLLAAGVNGYLSKSDTASDLLQAVEKLSRHEPSLASRVTELVLRDFLHKQGSEEAGELSNRERQVVTLLAQGKTNKEVAAALGLSPKTVEAHRANVMHKLSLQSFSDMIHFAIRTKMVKP